MNEIERIKELFQGKLLELSDDNFSVSVQYKHGVLPLFSKLMIAVTDKNSPETKKTFKIFNLIRFISEPELVELNLADERRLPDARRKAEAGIYTFFRTNKELLEILVIAAKNKGIFYYQSVLNDYKPPSKIEDYTELVKLRGTKLHIDYQKLESISNFLTFKQKDL